MCLELTILLVMVLLFTGRTIWIRAVINIIVQRQLEFGKCLDKQENEAFLKPALEILAFNFFRGTAQRVEPALFREGFFQSTHLRLNDKDGNPHT